MLNKKNDNYRLYLAGLISESRYYDLCEGVEDDISPNPMDELKLRQATLKFKTFMETFEDIGKMTPENAKLLLNAFLSAFLDHVSVINPTILRGILMDAIEAHKDKVKSPETTATESVAEHSDGNDMLKRNLMDICDHSKMILSMLDDEDVVEEWMRYKISVSNSNMSDVAHAFKHRKREQGGCFPSE